MKTPYKMYGKSPMMKKLIGKQNNLPEELKAKIKASPTKVDEKLSKKAKIVEMSKKHENSPGFKEYRDKVFGGKTTVKDKVSTTRKPAPTKNYKKGYYGS